jgi:hypothetical protein
MKTARYTFWTAAATVMLLSGHAFSQVTGDYRSIASGNWSEASTWETFDGTNWVAATNAPSGTGTITVRGDDTVRVNIAVNIAGYVKVEATGIIAITSGSLAFGNGSTYEHARDGGSVPTAIWGEGSTTLFTGATAGAAPDNRGQDYYNLVLNTPGLTANRDLNLQGRTIGGDITVINTGTARWQMVGGASGTVTIMGDVIVQAGQFTTQGTGSATNVVIEHHGNINVTGGNFSISRGSQGSGAGTTIWNLHEGNFSMSNATTQNSNPTAGQAKFVFAKEGGIQTLILSNVTYAGGGLPIQVDSAATLNVATNSVGGNGAFILSAGATLQTALAGGLNAAIGTTGTITLSKKANYTFDGTAAQVPGALLPDSVNVLTISNPAGVAFNDTLRGAELVVSAGSILQIEASGNVAADSGSVNGSVVNKGLLNSVAPLVFADGSVYEHARDGGSVPMAKWEKGSTALFTGIAAGAAPDNRGQDYYNLILNTPALTANRDLNLQGRTIGGDITVISTGTARWQLVGSASGTVTIMGDVIVQAGQLATQGTSSATNVVVDHYGDINVTGGNFSISRGSQGSGAGTTLWNLHEGNFSMSNATTQNSNPTAGNAKFVFAKEGGTQNLTLSNVTYAGGGLPIQVDSAATLNMGTTTIGGNGAFIVSAGATLQTALAGELNAALGTTGAITLSKKANYTFNGTAAQVPGTLLPDSVGVLTVSNLAGVAFNDTVRSAKLIVSPSAVMRIDSLGSVTADSGSVAGAVVNKGLLAAVAPMNFENGSVYEHARDGGSIPSGVWNEGSMLLMTGIVSTAPANKNQSYYNMTFNTPKMLSNLDMGLNESSSADDQNCEHRSCALAVDDSRCNRYGNCYHHG